MGYYSDVAVGMKKEDGVRFLNNFAMSVSDSALLDRGFTMRQHLDCVVFIWSDVKWYSSFRDVQWVETFLQELIQNDQPVAFARIGESMDDCEEWSCNDDDFDLLHNLFSVRRSIDLVFDKRKEVSM